MNYANMIGKKLKSAELSADKQRITFRFQDGFARSFGVDGDCCSSSWIEHFETPGRLDGAELLGVEDSASVQIDNHPEHDCLQVYWTKFNTSVGSIVLEFRNSSNGYYGGYLIDHSTPDEPTVTETAPA